MKQKGWDFVIESALGKNDENRHFRELKECLHKLNSLEDLSTEKIEQLLSRTKNDLEWIGLKAHIQNRKKVESMHGVSVNFCMQILRDHRTPFFNIDKTRAEAEMLMDENPEIRYGLLEELRSSLRQMYTNYEGEKDTPIIIDQMAQWERVSLKELLNDIDPGFAFNIVMEYFPDDGGPLGPRILGKGEKGKLIESLMLNETELRKAASNLVANNSHAYTQALFEVEFLDKGSNSAVLQFAKGNLLTTLQRMAHAEGREGQDEWGYVINSSALPLARNTLALYSPTGRMMNVSSLNEESKDEEMNEMETADFISMKHILSDNQNFSSEENATAVMILFWHRLPPEWQRGLREMYNTFDIDIDSFLTMAPDSFEVAANFSRDLVGLTARNQDFIEALNKYVDGGIKKIADPSRVPETVDANHFLVLMNTEHGHTQITDEEVRGVFEDLNFEALRYLQSSLGVDFNLISRREFFSLILYLKSKNGGDGFLALQKFIGGVSDQKDKADRIKSFLSLGSGFDGNRLLNLDALLGKEKSDYVFAKYADIVNASEDIVSYIEEHFGKDKKEQLTPGLIGEIREKMLVRGRDLLVRFAERIENGEEIDPVLLLKELEDARFSNTAFLFSLKTLNESGVPVRLEDIRSVSARMENAAGLSSADKEEIRRIYAENYKKKPRKRKRLLGVLENSLTNDANLFYVVRHGGKILGFYRVEDRGGKKHYAGSFNVDPQYQGVHLGEMILEQSLYERINRGEEIFEADCALFDGGAFEYIENGFIGMSTREVDEDISMNIHVNAKLNKAGIFETKTMPTQEIVRRARPGETVPLSDGRILIAAQPFLSRKSLPMEHVGEMHDGWRYVLTRYFHTEDEMGKRTAYAVFELVAKDILAEYQGKTEEGNERKTA